MHFGLPLTAAEAAIFESLVVPRYMQPFGDTAVPMLIPHVPAAVAHLGCRTGFPAENIALHLPGCGLVAVDNSLAALELARTKASLVQGLSATHVHADHYPTPLEGGCFTHAMSLHPGGIRGDYSAVITEMYRLLTSGGQMVMALPLRGSFPSLYDMLREYAVRNKLAVFGDAVDMGASSRPNPETLAEQCEGAGFFEVDVCIDLVAATFESGRDFLEDPIYRLVVGPDVRASLANEGGIDQAMEYLATAISKYWSEDTFELMINIGSVSARKP